MRAECGGLRLGLITNYWLKRLPPPPIATAHNQHSTPPGSKHGRNTSVQKLPANKSIFLNACGKGGKRACLYGKCLYGKDGKTRMLETWYGTHTMAKLWETSVGRSVTPTAVVMEYTPHSTIETCCGRGTYQHVSTDRTHPYGAVGVGGWVGATLWVMPITGPCTCQYDPTMASSWAGRVSEIILADISNRRRFVFN